MIEENRDRTLTINWPGNQVTVTLWGCGGGAVESNLHVPIQYDASHDDYEGEEEIRSSEDYNRAIDGIEALILAHALAGVDIICPLYIKGVWNAVDGCAYNC